MLNYTNGNWEYAQGELNYAHDKEAVADGEELLGSIVCGDWIICRIDNANEWKANALLISQAPAMYEALKAIYKKIEDAGNDENFAIPSETYEKMIDWQTDILEVIRKVENG